MLLPSTAHWSPALSGSGFVQGIDALRQSIRIILETPVGSNPLRVLFGSRVHDYIDWPINQARPHLVRETVDAVRLWEPRCSVTHVPVTLDAVNSQVIITPYFKPLDGTEAEFSVDVRFVRSQAGE